MLKDLFGLALGIKTLFLPCTSTSIDKPSMGHKNLKKEQKSKRRERKLDFCLFFEFLVPP